MENVYVKLNDKELEYLKKISKITMTDYELKGDFITVNSLITALEDILVEYDHLQEQYDDLQHDLEDNYRPISVEEQIGYNENW